MSMSHAYACKQHHRSMSAEALYEHTVQAHHDVLSRAECSERLMDNDHALGGAA